MARAIARETVMQLTFERIFADNDLELSKNMILEEIQKTHKKKQLLTPEDEVYVKEVEEGTSQHQEIIDNLIEKNAVGWTVERMSKIDLCILRLAIYELLYQKDTPSSVVINEAVNLGKKYSDPSSSRFINGILGTIYKTEVEQSENTEKGKQDEASGSGN